ncbi:WbqC family protein [Pleomorphovibrio marinus]|uniref:WbqC family protein n=1 Tax=Pleomorphovibrio marinus TaxID=2164132 RepID=UPI000E0C7C7C|nr:WbqC family protein [Pleomorphovibrio marinus]
MTEIRVLAADLFYLPNIEFFSSLIQVEELVLNSREAYVKQTYRNRAEVLLANKKEKLTVPVVEGNRQKSYKEVKIDYGQKWLNVHLRGIRSGYGKAPFFDYLFPDLEQVYKRKPPFLWDLNIELLTLCLQFLRKDVSIVDEENWKANGTLIDIRGAIKAKELYKQRGFYHPYPYLQMFGLDFVPNLSVIDLLFCEGPASERILSLSRKRK